MSERLTNGCRMCEAGQLGKAWADDLLNGTKTLAEAAQYFEVSSELVWRHVMEHELGSVEQSPFNVKTKLWKLIRIAEDWLEYLIMHEQPSARTIKQVVLLLSEIRKLLTFDAELEGQIKTAPEVKVFQLNQIMQVVVGELCSNCQEKILRVVEGKMDERRKLLTC